METVDWCPVGGDHCWTLKLGGRKEECGGDEDCSWVHITYDLHEECLKCLKVRPLERAAVSATGDDNGR